MSLGVTKGGFKAEDTGDFFHCQHEYSKSLSWADNLNFPPKTGNNLFKFSAPDSDLQYLCWQWKNYPESSEIKPPLNMSIFLAFIAHANLGLIQICFNFD